jgi:adenine deaminase
MDDMETILAVARGQRPADLVLSGGRIVNVFTGLIESADVAIAGRWIAGVGAGYQGDRRVELDGAFVAPGFIDAHVHIESSLCVPREFAAAVLPRGVTAVVADPHEIANVAGAAGVRFMADSSRGLPLDVILMAPSCVPATNMSTAGGEITVEQIVSLAEEKIVHGLAEVMNFPGVIAGEKNIRGKIRAMGKRPVDGHCPGVSGKSLSAYIAAGVGSDHESVTAEEAEEKLARGLRLLIREATNARNLDALLPVVTRGNSRRVCFCTDDRTPSHLLAEGSVDEMVRRAIGAGIDPVEAIRMATLNTAEWFGLANQGAIGPGRLANLVVFDDLSEPSARMVFSHGEVVAKDGMLVKEMPADDASGAKLGRCEVKWEKIDLRVPARTERIRVIGARAGQLVTDHLVLPAKCVEGNAVAEVAADVLKMAVIERHHGSGKFAVGFVRGFGLKRGAIAGTVAHDHHNLVAIGADDQSMLRAAHAVVEMGGGLAVAAGEQVVAEVALPVGGLMTHRPIKEVAAAYDRLIAAAAELGSSQKDPFMAMSFMALEVIPTLKLTDKGLVDVDEFKLVDLFV